MSFQTCFTFVWFSSVEHKRWVFFLKNIMSTLFKIMNEDWGYCGSRWQINPSNYNKNGPYSLNAVHKCSVFSVSLSQDLLLLPLFIHLIHRRVWHPWHFGPLGILGGWIIREAIISKCCQHLFTVMWTDCSSESDLLSELVKLMNLMDSGAGQYEQK